MKGYTWAQTEEDIELTIPLADGLTAKTVKVQILPASIKVESKVDGKLLTELELFGRVR